MAGSGERAARLRTPVVAAALVATWLAAGPAAAASRPTITGPAAYPATVASGGTSGVSATVTGAANCTLTAPKSKPVPGLPAAVSCAEGSAIRVVAMPANHGRRPVAYKLTLTAVGVSGKGKTKAKVTVTVEPEEVAVANKELIAVGVSSSCAIVTHGESTGTIKCWGGKGQGELGDGGSTSGVSATPVPVVGVTNAVEVAAGREHACALLATGHIKCWGRATGLGNGSYAGEFGESTPVAVVNIANAVQITAGEYDACAVLATGHVACWGENKYGQLGQKTLQVEQLSPLEIPEYGNVAEVAAGREHTCARVLAGEVDCWGSDSHGQLGDGASGLESFSPKQIIEATGAKGISSGEEHSCVVAHEEGHPSGQIKCWGWDRFGQLGDDNVGEAKKAVNAQEAMLLPISGAYQVSAGREHTCALLRTGRAECWGSDERGQLGDGHTTEQRVAVPVSGGLSKVVEIDASQLHTCALLEDGGVKCWGSDNSGELGNGTVQPFSSEPVAVTGFP